MAFFRLIRVGNLLIMFATQAIAYYFLTGSVLLEDLWSAPFLNLAIATILTAAAGNIINDYYDVELDQINKPGSVIIGAIISKRVAIVSYLFINGIAILFAIAANTNVAISTLLCIVALWFYSAYFKKMFLVGNLVVAILSSFTLIILLFLRSETSASLILCYAIFAFGVSLLREIIKDIEDIEGDQLHHAHTVPIVLGVSKTKWILLSIEVLIIVSVFVYLRLIAVKIEFSRPVMANVYAIYMQLAVVLPLLYLGKTTLQANVKKDFSFMSRLVKLIMVTGILSIFLIN